MATHAVMDGKSQGFWRYSFPTAQAATENLSYRLPLVSTSPAR